MTWDDHLERIHAFFTRLTNAKLTINMVKSEFAKAQIVFLGHVVGQGQVQPEKQKGKQLIAWQRLMVKTWCWLNG